MLERPFTITEHGGVLVVSGAVDEFSVVRLRTAITDRVGDGDGDVVVDLTDVDVLPSVGVGVLARVAEQARRDGRSVHLVADADTIAQRVLQVCGLQYSHTPPAVPEPPTDPSGAGRDQGDRPVSTA